MHVVLIIAGEHDTRVALRKYLEAEGYVVHTAISGHFAFELLKSIETPSVILLDESTPFTKPDDFVKKKKATTGLEKIPVVLMVMDESGCEVKGVDSLLGKPIEAVKLVSLVSKFCSESN